MFFIPFLDKTKRRFRHFRATMFSDQCSILLQVECFLETVPFFYRIFRIVHLESVFDVEIEFCCTFTHSNVVFVSFSPLRTISLCSFLLSFSDRPQFYSLHKNSFSKSADKRLSC